MAITLNNHIPYAVSSSDEVSEIYPPKPLYHSQATDAITNPVVIILSILLSLIILSILWTPFVLMMAIIGAAWAMLLTLIYMAIWPIILDIFRPGYFEE